MWNNDGLYIGHEPPRHFRVHYVAGPYSGHCDVDADDAAQAVAIVRAKIRREMTLPMYADSYTAEEL
jgi:hypothetical protein